MYQLACITCAKVFYRVSSWEDLPASILNLEAQLSGGCSVCGTVRRSFGWPLVASAVGEAPYSNDRISVVI